MAKTLYELQEKEKSQLNMNIKSTEEWLFFKHSDMKITANVN